MEYQAKLMKKTPFLYCISSSEGTSYKKLQFTATSSFISCCFTSAFTLADTYFYNILEVYSTLFEKRFSS